MNLLIIIRKTVGVVAVGCSALLGITAISSDASIKTSQPKRRLELRALSSQHPTLHSPTLGVSLAKLTPDEARRIFSKARLQPRRLGPTFLARLRGFYLLYICPNLVPHLQQNILQLAIHWPRLQPFLPTIRNHAAWGALSDRVRIQSGEALSVCPRDLLVRQLVAYRDELSKILVIPNVSS